jgi:hypothetical protein
VDAVEVKRSVDVVADNDEFAAHLMLFTRRAARVKKRPRGASTVLPRVSTSLLSLQ